MAFRREALVEIGGFDPATGAGTPAMGGDDLSAFFGVIDCGWQLVYEPSAVIRHTHHREESSLRGQAYGYGVGLGAYLTKTLLDKPGRIIDLSRKALRGLGYASRLREEREGRIPLGTGVSLSAIERRGLLHGPYAYLKSRWKYRKVPRQKAIKPQGE
jgi:hypothetical protein